MTPVTFQTSEGATAHPAEMVGGCALLLGNCLSVLQGFTANSIHSVVADPPYGLVKNSRKGSAQTGEGNTPHGRTGPTKQRGFMGKDWDTGETAFDPAFWFEALRVLKPGGHVLAFGGTRTYHRLASAIEDAGFEIRDQIGWLYGSGFPKSHNQEGEWEGWGTALKPGWEPIVMARKPLDGTVAGNLAEWGVGALNIDGCRVPTDDIASRAGGRRPSTHEGYQRPGATMFQDKSDWSLPDNGRWPANVIHDGSDEVLDAFPMAPGQLADASTNSSSRKTQNVYGAMKRDKGREGEASAKSDNEGSVGFKMKPGARRLDGGSAARFFYCAKASKADRGEGNTHPTVKPTALMRYLCRLVTPPGGTVLDPFMGSGSTGRGAVLEGFQFVGIERERDYYQIAISRVRASVKAVEERENSQANHPDLFTAAAP